VLSEYQQHYNSHRPHRALGQAAPLRPLPQPTTSETNTVRRRDRDPLSGLRPSPIALCVPETLHRSRDLLILVEQPSKPGRCPCRGRVLRTLHVLLAKEDPTFADLRRVTEAGGRYLWVHRRYLPIYQPRLPDIPG